MKKNRYGQSFEWPFRCFENDCDEVDEDGGGDGVVLTRRGPGRSGLQT